MAHLFITQADLNTLHADAVLVPTDGSLHVMEHWAPLLAGTAMESQHVVMAVTPEWREGAQRTLPLPPTDEGPRRWLTNTGGVGASPEWYAEGVGEFVARAAQDRMTSAGRVRPLLALPLVGTGAGGAARMAGDLTRRLLGVLWAASREHDVDVALVCHGPVPYAAAQWARRQELRASGTADATHWQLGDDAVAQAGRLAEDAHDGRLVAFVGAGVGSGAGLPSWNGLLEELGRRAGLSPDERAGLGKLDPLDRAQIIERRLEERGDDLMAEISSVIAASRCALAHTLLASLPVDEFVTTNYDGLLELACGGTDRPAAVLPYNPRPGRRWVLKLHGSATHHRRDLVLTRADFLRYSDQRGALAGIVQAMLITRHMLFTGFSLDDPNFHRIADEVRKALGGGRDPDAAFGTVVTLDRQPLLEELWRSDLRFVAALPDGPIGEAGNAHDRFLDLVGSLAASVSRHLLDDGFSGLLDEADEHLAGLLRAVIARAAPARQSGAWPDVETLLLRLGWNGAPAVQESVRPSPGSWSADELHRELGRFEDELKAAGLAASSVHTYVDRSARFLRWLQGGYTPGT